VELAVANIAIDEVAFSIAFGHLQGIYLGLMVFVSGQL
jgi:hypothetical protein